MAEAIPLLEVLIRGRDQIKSCQLCGDSYAPTLVDHGLIENYKDDSNKLVSINSFKPQYSYDVRI
jgi:hypothetical protein